MERLKTGSESLGSSQTKIEVEQGDLDVILSGAIIVQGKLRDLIALRETIKKDRGRFHFVYARNSSLRLYVVSEDEFMLIKKLRESEEPKRGETKR